MSAEHAGKKFSKHAQRMLSSLGFAPIESPADRASIRLDMITEIDPEMLSEKLTQLAGWTSYAEQKQAILKGALIRAQNDLDTAYALKYRSRPSSEKVGDKKQIVRADPDIVSRNTDVATLQADLEVVQALVRSYERLYNAVSRELTRRLNSQKGH